MSAQKRKNEEDEGENVSRTGRQRKKSAKVLEMEAEADELAQVLRARMDPSSYRPRPPVNKGPRVKKTATRAELEAVHEMEMDEPPILEPEQMDEPVTPPQAVVPDAMSKSGRVRKKSAKLMEMVEAEQLDRKTFRTSHIPKSMRNALNPSTSTPTPTKKAKSAAASSTTSGSPPAQNPTTIKHILSSPKKTHAGPSSPPPEPILAQLGASLGASPTKAAQIPVPVQAAMSVPQTGQQVVGVLGTSPTGGSAGKKELGQSDFAVKFLADNLDGVSTTPKPHKKKSKKQATPTPSAPAPVPLAEKVAAIVSSTSPPTKAGMPKLKNLLSPPKKPPVMAATMADQPLLSKIMGEVANIGPPPPSTAEAKSMKKKAKKEAAYALKNQSDGVLKKLKKEDPGTTALAFKPMPKAVPFTPSATPVMGVQPLSTPYMGDDDEDDSDSDLDADQLMIDTTKGVEKRKPAAVLPIKKEKTSPKKSKAVEPGPPQLDMVMPQVINMDIKQEQISEGEEMVVPPMAAEEDVGDDEDPEDEDDLDDEGEEVDIDTPTTYANTHVMANKVQTSSEKKASKEKKKKKGKKDEPDKQKKKRGPTAYMLWCNAHRQKLVKENPGIDFATISRRLGEMWSGQTEKEKMAWKKKAKKIASKGSTIISTGKGVSQMVHGGSGATLLNKPSSSSTSTPTSSSSTASSRSASRPMSAPAVPAARNSSTATAHQPKVDHDQVPIPLKASGCSPLDVAAHLKLLGESLSIIGARLQEHHGQIAVQGTLPVLLDSLLCALGPLTTLTTTLPQLDGAPLQTHASTLDNIAYIMPGIG